MPPQAPPFAVVRRSASVLVVAAMVATVAVSAQLPAQADHVPDNVSGTVFLPGGTTPASGALVRALDGQGRFLSPPVTDMSGPSGNFALTLAHPGSYQLVADAPPGSSRVASAPYPVDLSATDSATGITLVLRTANLTGTVEEAGVQPLANAFVQAQVSGQFGPPAAQANSGNDGTFAMVLEPGTYDLTANTPPGSPDLPSVPLAVTIAPDGTATPGTINLQLRTANVTGTVLGPDGHTVVDNAFVRAETPGQPGPPVAQTSSRPGRS